MKRIQRHSINYIIISCREVKEKGYEASSNLENKRLIQVHSKFLHNHLGG